MLHPQGGQFHVYSTGTAGASLPWTCGETLRQELGPWRMLPWNLRAKPLEGRTAMVHVVCCVLCVVCFLCCVLCGVVASSIS